MIFIKPIHTENSSNASKDSVFDIVNGPAVTEVPILNSSHWSEFHMCWRELGLANTLEEKCHYLSLFDVPNTMSHKGSTKDMAYYTHNVSPHIGMNTSYWALGWTMLALGFCTQTQWKYR
ncbi:hypothetical protein CEXT_410701 [Caerostris extrusa]|uniref:Uncharacterized protein n=1 Tax=Caerostris extrusa TaxID=172846 RepID=A0AAV4RE04_CAEEX|nr:hypothetical protein CEXT_410701 [Caerostris extrusa]